MNKLTNLQENEAAFEALGQWEKNKRKNQEWWNDELKDLRVEKENACKTEQMAKYKNRNKD